MCMYPVIILRFEILNFRNSLEFRRKLLVEKLLTMYKDWPLDVLISLHRQEQKLSVIGM